ncbi:type VI secretion system protein TssL, short form [Commensalibacter nepenthis]|uniref:Type VI secretion system protein TssL, short form n=1 Tax=Commensalibacter nepenthis TaxID=3043872 RepID=A0ABT6Q4S6_9PROT|nr:type VI secretion system protein TssL, short form [Commensalibacter sp. TBRC 10068]MDI2111742.1 type VI secretion system protein TssL, short form [Commensalibacter sp. TBRC 10068]
MKNDIALDSLMLDTWLLVASLKNGIKIEDGDKLYEKAIAMVDTVKKKLQEQKQSEENIEHITYAQCALLDEAVLDRTEMDSGYNAWVQTPLQVKFFNTMNAGEILFERIKAVLNQPAPNLIVLTCFQRVLALGYQGRYKHLPKQDLTNLTKTLTNKVGVFDSQAQPILINTRYKSPVFKYLRSFYLWIIVSIIIVTFLWIGLNSHLEQLLHQWLPVIKN